MSDARAFNREEFPPGDSTVHTFQHHESYDTPPEVLSPRHEAEHTSGYAVVPGEQYGFLTDTSICIGCKACEVACKEWNHLPADDVEWLATSYDNTHTLGHKTWRHVSFIEQPARNGGALRSAHGEAIHPPPRWLFHSDICKHCDHAGCLEACPTGAITRTEFGTVLIQQDICNGCNYCVPSCPFGVITVGMEEDGKAHKCTLCYDRLKSGMEPACAKACPTDSIQFGPVAELRARAERRVTALQANGLPEASLYGQPGGAGATHGVEGLRSFFLLLDHPNVYNLPVAPRLPSRNIVPGLAASAVTAVALIGATALALLGGRRREPRPGGETGHD